MKPVSVLSLSSLSLLVLVLAGCGDSTDNQPATTLTDAKPVTPVSSQPCYTPFSQQDLHCNVGDRIFYDFDKYNIKSEYESIVAKQAEWLKKGNVKSQVIGHADERGSAAYNMILARKRALEHLNALINHGVNPSNISAVSRGKEGLWPSINKQQSDQESIYAGNRASMISLNAKTPFDSVSNNNTVVCDPMMPSASVASETQASAAACDPMMDLPPVGTSEMVM